MPVGPVSDCDLYIGLDLGQTTDPSAIAILERVTTTWPDYNRVTWVRRQKRFYHVRYLETLPLGTSYLKVVDRVCRMVRSPRIQGNCDLVFDATSLGRPVLDMFRAAGPGCRLTPLTITSGDNPTRSNVPKGHLLLNLSGLMEKGALRIAANLPQAKTLRREFQNFRQKLTRAANTTYNAATGHHDDLILAIALAAYRANQKSCGAQPFNRLL